MSTGAARRNGDVALSEVIGFIMLLAVITAAFALWMMYIVPINGRQNEIEQMNTVKDRFTDYKISLDSLWINSEKQVTLSTSFNLGSGGGTYEVSGLFLPMLDPIASSATMSVKDGGDTMVIKSLGPSDSVVKVRNYTMSVLEYQSQNNYWIQQRYYYQSGGVFLSQDNGSVCRVAPPVSYVMNSDSTCSATIVPITMDNTGSMGGNGPVRVDSQIKSLSTVQSENVYWVNTTVVVADSDAALMWLEEFNTSRRTGRILNPLYYSFGNSSPGRTPGIAFINISGPYGDKSVADVALTVQPVNYSVTINSIASNLN